MTIKILLVLAALLVVGVATVLILAAMKPSEFVVERSIAIDAPPAAIYPLIADFREFQKWSPFEKSDPDMQRTLSGPESGVGSVYAWNGNSHAGEGTITIVEAEPSKSVTMDLHMTRPFGCRNVVLYSIEPEGDATRVTWRMSGPSPFMSKVMQVFMDMDKMCGDQFEEGLASLKTLAEQRAGQSADAGKDGAVAVR